jgi:hypothetical protein
MVWKGTTELGCGVAPCNGSPFYVCNYNPPVRVAGCSARMRWRVRMFAAGVPAQALQDSVAVTTRAATTAPLWRSRHTETGQHGGRLQQQRVPGQVQVMAWLLVGSFCACCGGRNCWRPSVQGCYA